MEIAGKEGRIEISNEVMMTVIKEAVKEVEGVIAFSGGLPGNITEVFSTKTSSQKGVKIRKGEQIVTVNISLVLKLGVKIPEVVEKVQKRICDKVLSMTDVKVERVDVYVQEVRE